MAIGSQAREHPLQMVHYLRRGITFEDNGSVLTVGIIPAGALILKPASGVHVVTAFDAGTSNVLDVGTNENDDLFGTDLALGAANFVALDESIGGFRVAADTVITCTPTLSGTAATAGDAEVIITYIPDNDK